MPAKISGAVIDREFSGRHVAGLSDFLFHALTPLFFGDGGAAGRRGVFGSGGGSRSSAVLNATGLS
jgi:hypothetical protein